MNEDTLQRIARAIRDKLEEFQLAPGKTDEAGYDDAIARVIRNAPTLQAQVEWSKARVEQRYTDLMDQPAGRRETVLANSSPTMLMALAYNLMRQSHSLRFTDTKQTLELANLAHETARSVFRAGYLSEPVAADLVAEALDYLGNARRVNSDVLGAEQALEEAEKYLESGTRDREIRARHYRFRAALCHTQGRAREAARLWDREVALRRLLRDPARLGVALLDRGLAACWEGDLRLASDLVCQGVELVEDARMVFMGLVNLAEAFVREGNGPQAWKLLCLADRVGAVANTGTLRVRHRWVKAITYRALGQPLHGEELLRSVRGELLEHGLTRSAAIATVDLLALLVSLGKEDQLVELAQEAYAAFVAERLESRALSVFLILHRAVQAEKLSEDLAVQVANFLVRFQHNRNLRFEQPTTRAGSHPSDRRNTPAT